MDLPISSDRSNALLRRLTPYAWIPWLGIAIVAASILWDRLHAIDGAAVLHRIATTPTAALCIGVCCCLGVNLLAGLYEGIAVHRATGQHRWMHASMVASIANPVGHMVGNAILGSGALRYRLHGAAGLNTRQIGAVIALTAMPFLLAVGWLIDLTLVLFSHDASKAVHVAVPIVIGLGILGLMKDAGWLWFVSTRTGPLRIAGHPVHIPGLSATLLQTAIGIGEVVLSATVLHVLLPAQVGLSTFTAIFLLATMFGQLSHVPAGLGVFEAAMLLMLPQVPAEQMIGAVLVYRVIYDLLPLGVALALLLAHETFWRKSRNAQAARCNAP